jgi:outer membrane protein assembly factor BamB
MNSGEPVPPPGEAKPPPPPESRALRDSLVRTAWLAGAFCLLVGAILLWFYMTGTTNDPWKSPQLLALKEQLVAEPKNEQLKLQIRDLDVEYRRNFRRRLSLDRSGGWLLLGGAVALVLAARGAFNLNQRLVLSPPKSDANAQAMRLAARSRWAVAGVGASIAAALLLVVLAGRDVVSEPGKSAPVAPAVVAPTLAEFRANYPRFRGWDGSGVTPLANAPLAWDDKTGAGIAWKSAVLAPGHNSPVVWSNRLFISGGTADRREVFAYDTANGQLLWRRAVENVPGSPAKVPEIPEDTGYAASTTATDGQFIFAIFGNGDLAAIAFDGVIAWAKALGPLKNPYGHAASLAIWPGQLLVQLDQGDNTPANSKLLALEPRTGRLLWERSRPVSASWATPIVVENSGQTRIFTAGVPWVIAYNGEDGAELWRADLLEGEVVPSPVFAGGLVFAVSPGSRLMALRTDGAGDVSKTAVVWTNEENATDVPSPVSNGELVFTANGLGMLTCFDAKSGAKIWAQDLQTQVDASPAIVGGRLFILGLNGVAVVAEAGRQFKEIARSQLPDKFIASPAFVEGRTFFRGESNLFCIQPMKTPKP